MLKRVIVGIAIALGVAGWGYRAELVQLYKIATMFREDRLVERATNHAADRS